MNTATPANPAPKTTNIAIHSKPSDDGVGVGVATREKDLIMFIDSSEWFAKAKSYDSEEDDILNDFYNNIKKISQQIIKKIIKGD